MWPAIFVPYVDVQHQVLIQSTTKDGGDSMSRTCAAISFMNLRGQKVRWNLIFGAVSTFMYSYDTNYYRRHPDSSKWYSRVNTTSRDQYRPLLTMLATFKMRESLKSVVFKNFAKRGFIFSHNTKRNHVYPTLEEHRLKSTFDVPWDYSSKIPDLLGMTVYATILRAWSKDSLLARSALYLLDIEFFVNSVLLYFNDEIDVQNHVLALELFDKVTPTFWSKLGKKISLKAKIYERFEKFFSQPGEPPLHLIK
jgi:hypothetical protein